MPNLMSVEVRIDSLRRVLRELDGLPIKLRNNALRVGLVAGAQVFRDEAKRRAPIGPVVTESGRRVSGGLLRKRIRVIRRRGSRTEVRVNTASQAPHSHLVEFGTVERIQYTTGRYTGRMPRLPFLRPAFDTKDGEAVDAIAARVRRYLKEKVGTRRGIRR